MRFKNLFEKYGPWSKTDWIDFYKTLEDFEKRVEARATSQQAVQADVSNKDREEGVPCGKVSCGYHDMRFSQYCSGKYNDCSGKYNDGDPLISRCEEYISAQRLS